MFRELTDPDPDLSLPGPGSSVGSMAALCLRLASLATKLTAVAVNV